MGMYGLGRSAPTQVAQASRTMFAPLQQAAVMGAPRPTSMFAPLAQPVQQAQQQQQQRPDVGNIFAGLVKDPKMALKLASSLGKGTAFGAAATKAIPVVGALMGGASTLKSIKAGDTKGGALSGAATGASIGSIVPGLGTVLGGAVGALVGGVGAALHGKTSVSEKTWDSYKQYAGTGGMSQLSDADAGEVFKGMWDTNQKVFKGTGTKEQFMQGMGDALYQGVQSGKIAQNADSATVAAYLKPWMESAGANLKGNSNPIFWNSVGDLGQRFLSGQTVGVNKEAAGAVNYSQFQPQPSAMMSPTMGPNSGAPRTGLGWAPLNNNPFTTLMQKLQQQRLG